MDADLVYALGGAALLLAVLLPLTLQRVPVSAPMVLILVGALIGLLPQFSGVDMSPIDHRVFTEHLTEATVLVALMGVGLALDRPLRLRNPRTWKAWGATWRLLGIAMPLCIAGVAVLGWTVMGLAPAAAVLLGSALAPTDPVLASDVRVGGPTTAGNEGSGDHVDEHDEVRFALTSEAALNDGLAFPFVYLAIMMAGAGPVADWAVGWFAWELVGKVLIGLAVGTVLGRALARVVFQARRPSLRLAEIGEPLFALAAVMLAYGVSELVGGYGFLSVFACGFALRSAERGHDYHVHMHGIVERLERLLTLVVLLLLGVAMTNGLLRSLTWGGVATGLLLVLLVRPATGWLALSVGQRKARVGPHALEPRERRITAFFGVRGVGSLYYVAYATGQAQFGDHATLWATVGFTVALSAVLHGVAESPVMARLDRARAG